MENLKLELTILSGEIKKALPNLEQEALRQESISNSLDTSSSSADLLGSVPDVFLKHPADMRAEIQRLADETSVLKSHIKEEEGRCSSDLATLRAVVRGQREEFMELAEECSVLRLSTSRMQRLAAGELITTDMVTREIAR